MVTIYDFCLLQCTLEARFQVDTTHCQVRHFLNRDIYVLYVTALMTIVRRNFRCRTLSYQVSFLRIGRDTVYRSLSWSEKPGESILGCTDNFELVRTKPWLMQIAALDSRVTGVERTEIFIPVLKRDFESKEKAHTPGEAFWISASLYVQKVHVGVHES